MTKISVSASDISNENWKTSVSAQNNLMGRALQATIEIALLLLVHTTHVLVLHAHPVRGESHIQCNANRAVATTSLLFIMNRTNRTFFLWRLHLAQSSHPGHSTILLRPESLSGKCTMLLTVAATNNRDHLSRSLYLLVCATYIWVIFFAHILFVVNRTFNATPTERLQHE